MIIVVGSANQDYIVRVPTPPAPGETILAEGMLTQPGGKGANQAVAAARLGGAVALVAAVGDDSDGALLRDALRDEGVDTSEVGVVAERTGLALISVFDSGENVITVVPGANFALGAEHVTEVVEQLAAREPASVLVVQAELRAEVIEAAVRTADRVGVRCILNLAPFQRIGDDLEALCDPLILNETEAGALVGWKVDGVESAARAAEEVSTTARSVVITLGALGAYWSDQTGSGHVPAATGGRAVDTTGAGDAFVGAMAVCLARGESLPDAVELGVRAGTFAIGSVGAQSSYARLEDLQR